MKMSRLLIIATVALVASLVTAGVVLARGLATPSSSPAAATLLGTAFSYQGNLKHLGAPANGAFDFQAKLFDSATAGAQIGATVVKDDVTVADGVFTVQLDFGAGAFTGDARWLEIGARVGSSTGSFTLLTPRQELTPTPYAIFATAATALAADPTDCDAGEFATAIAANGNLACAVGAGGSGDGHSLDAADGSPVDALFIDNEGDVGIGTTSPNEQLEITGNFRLPASTATTGIIKSDGNPFIHSFGTDNFFAGVNAGNLTMSGPQNTAVGETALSSNTTGSQNTAAGAFALQDNTTGADNTGTGNAALYLNTTGNSNTATGGEALRSNTTGNSNTATGRTALFSNTIGVRNTADGASALQSNTTGENNTATGVSALQSNTTGNRNTAAGEDALASNTTGSNNTAIGFEADVSAGNLTNATAIGNGAVVDASNKIRLGDGSVTVVETGGSFSTTAGNLELPASTATAGIINSGGSPFIHSFGTDNFFAGVNAGNLTMTGAANMAAGTNALRSNTTGSNNTAAGKDALIANTTGGSNTAAGALALPNNTTGSNNTAVGKGALATNTTGASNTASGASALALNATGLDNTATGVSALQNNASGSRNLAAGRDALLSNTTGSNNTAIGFQADVSTGNLTNATAIGNGAVVDASNKIRLGNGSVTVVETDGSFSTTAGNLELPASTATAGIINSGGSPFIHSFGTDNFFAGVNAGNLTMTGQGNTAAGQAALQNNTTGNDNTAAGVSALQSNTTGSNNLAAGVSALQDNTTGSGSTAAGIDALQNNTTGNNNTATGAAALFANTTGSINTATGTGALQSNTTGSSNTAIGFLADVSTGNLTNATAIGANAVVDASNKIRLGDGSVTVIEGQVAFTFSSDVNRKENFRPVDGERTLEKVSRLNLESWNFKGHDPQQFRHYGPTAQEFFAAFGDDGFGVVGTETTINSGDIDGVMMVAIQALEKRTADLASQQARIADLEQLAGEQETLLQRMEERLEALEAVSGAAGSDDGDNSPGLPSFSGLLGWLLLGAVAPGAALMGGWLYVRRPKASRAD